MAVDEHLPEIVVGSSGSSSVSSNSPNNQRRKRLIQIATENSSAFIRFPRSQRLNSSIVPVNRTRPSLSSARLSSATTEQENNAQKDQQRSQSLQRSNPILENPLLNHRKASSDVSSIVQIDSTNKTRPKTNDRIVVLQQKQQQLAEQRAKQNQVILYLGKVKFDYIQRWLNEVHRQNFQTSDV